MKVRSDIISALGFPLSANAQGTDADSVVKAREAAATRPTFASHLDIPSLARTVCFHVPVAALLPRAGAGQPDPVPTRVTALCRQASVRLR